MKIDLLALQLAVILLPGLMWARLDARYAAKEAPSDLQFLLRAFVFGIVIYLTVFLLYHICGWPFTMVDFAQAADRQVVTSAVLKEIGCGLGLGGCLAAFWLAACRRKLLTRTLQRIGLTKKFGDDDVWDYTFNSGIAAVQYVHVRDFGNQFVHAGWVNTFSENRPAAGNWC